MADCYRGSEPTNWAFDWRDIRGELHALGGMLGPVEFHLPSGRTVQPFAVAPWANDPAADLAALPPLLRQLRGEWPCVPFGLPSAREDLPAHWMQGMDGVQPADDGCLHGYGANHLWRLQERGTDELTVAIDYPAAHPVKSLTRRIRRCESNRLAMTLGIDMRRDARLPIGLHPVFSLPAETGGALLTVPPVAAIRTFSVAVEPGVSCLQPDVAAADLRALPDTAGGTRDLTRLPLSSATEELLLCIAPGEGRVELANRVSGYRVILRWDITRLPHCLLWISNRGRGAYPWNRRFCAVGIEPVAAAFDLGQRHSNNPQSPLAAMGQATSVALSAKARWEIDYDVTVSDDGIA